MSPIWLPKLTLTKLYTIVRARGRDYIENTTIHPPFEECVGSDDGYVQTLHCGEEFHLFRFYATAPCVAPANECSEHRKQSEKLVRLSFVCSLGAGTAT